MEFEIEEPLKAEYLDGIPCLLCLKKILPMNAYGHIKMCLAKYEEKYGLGNATPISNPKRKKELDEDEVTIISQQAKNKKEIGRPCDLPKALCVIPASSRNRKMVCIELNGEIIKVMNFIYILLTFN